MIKKIVHKDPIAAMQKSPKSWVVASLFSMLFALLMVPGYAATLGARLDRNSITAGETVSLSIALPQSGNAQPDFNPLLKNFDILGTSSSSQIQIINGKRSESRELIITLMPHQQGKLEIPALKVGQDSTTPLTLTVNAAPTIDSATAGNPVWLELESPLQSQDVMVNQEIPLTVRLYTTLPLRDISLSKPAPANAVVETLGEAKQYQAERDGKSYQVIEQQYAVFPEQAGDLTIPPVVLRAMVPDPQQARSGRTSPFDDPFFKDAFAGNSGLGSLFNDSFFSGGLSRGKPLTLGSAGLKFSVAHIPEAAKGQNWLPASKVELEDSWKGKPPAFKSGEPVTLTVTVTAEGLSGSQIPALTFPPTPNLRVYNEPAKNESFSDGEHVTGVSTQTFTLVAESSGELKLPALTLPWWNLNTQSMQTAELPAHTVQVAQGSGVASSPAPAAAATVPASTANAAVDAANGGENSSTPIMSDAMQAEEQTWLGLEMDTLLLIFGVLSILILFFIATKRQPPTQSAASPAGTNPANNAVPTANKNKLLSLKQDCLHACEANDAREAARTLLLWAQQAWPENPPTSLKEVADNLVDGAEEVRALNAHLYQSQAGGHAWYGNELAKALGNGLIRNLPTETKDDPKTLQPLYPA